MGPALLEGCGGRRPAGKHVGQFKAGTFGVFAACVLWNLARLLLPCGRADLLALPGRHLARCQPGSRRVSRVTPLASQSEDGSFAASSALGAVYWMAALGGCQRVLRGSVSVLAYCALHRFDRWATQ